MQALVRDCREIDTCGSTREMTLHVQGLVDSLLALHGDPSIGTVIINNGTVVFATVLAVVIRFQHNLAPATSPDLFVPCPHH